MYHNIASITQLFRLPARCNLCNQHHDSKIAICAECLFIFKKLGPACRHCAHPLPDDFFLVCGHCCRKKPYIDLVRTAYCFEEPLRSLLHEFKYREGLYLLSTLGQLMMDALPKKTLQTECLIPVPMHPKRLSHRGFNQAAELTKYVGRVLKLPYELSYCKKINNTPPQAHLKAKERQTNLKDAFQAKSKSYQHVTLIDDLMTTGNTANELARILKKQGVVQVDLWCIARAT